MDEIKKLLRKISKKDSEILLEIIRLARMKKMGRTIC